MRRSQPILAGGLGCQLTNDAQAELVYLYQVRSHGSVDPANQQPVVALNHGVRLNVVYSLDFTK